MKKRKALIYLMSLALCASLLTACSNKKGSDSSSKEDTVNKASVEFKEVTVKYDKDDYYFDWKNESFKTINVSKDKTEITKSGIYEITGTLKNGSLVVDVDKDKDNGIVYLVLNNTRITSKTSAPIYVKDAEKVVIILENSTTNTITQGSDVKQDSDGNPTATIFSKSDLTITGCGTLKVKTDFNDGITSKDKLKITDGVIEIDAKNDGIVGKDVLGIEKVDVTIKAGKDGMRSTNDTETGKGNIVITDGDFDIEAGNDAIQAYAILQVNGGSFDLSSGGGYSGEIKTSDTGAMGGGKFPGNFNQDGNQQQMPQMPSGADGGQSTPPDISSGATGQQGQRPDMPQFNPDRQKFDFDNMQPSGKDNQKTEKTETDSKKALKSDGGIFLKGGTFTISAYEDAIHSSGNIQIDDGTYKIKSGDDGIHTDADLIINNGTITVENSYEAFEGANITVNNGTIAVKASDDGFNTATSSSVINLNNGTIQIDSSGDGFDSNGNINITGGTIHTLGAASGPDAAIDYDGKFTISGGVLIGSGTTEMAQAPDNSSSQSSILMYYTNAQAANTTFSLKDSNGKVIASFTPSKQYTAVVISTPEIKKGSTYTLYSGETKVVTFTTSDTTTFLNESGITTNQGHSPGGNGGAGGGKFPGGMTRPDKNNRGDSSSTSDK